MNTRQHLFCFLSRWTVGLLYDRAYLTGRWFTDTTKGWRWCWKNVWSQKVLGFNRKVPFPVAPGNRVGNAAHIRFSPNDLNNFQNMGCYFQAYEGHITIGEGTWIAPGVGLITANHDPTAPDRHLPAKDIVLGEHCWIGMNAVILPGVTLGAYTTVGAGAVVTKSFPQGHCVLVGNPAHIIRENVRENAMENVP